MKQPLRLSCRQLKLLESATPLPADEKVRSEVVHALADLLLAALGLRAALSAETRNESED